MHSGVFARNDVERVGRVRHTALFGCLAVALVVWVGGTVHAQDADRQHVAEARAALDEYFRAWNAADNDAVAAISNFPRLSLGQNGQVVVRETPEAIATDFDVLRQSGWDHSNRLELGEPEKAQCDRYKKILADERMIDTLLVDLFLDSERRPPAQVVLDLDATDDPLHGNQEGRFFHGYYGHYCYLPLYITCGEHVLRCRLRRADGDASDGAVEELKAVVAQIRQRWPETKILVRGDSGFCRDPIMVWCEGNGVDYVLGLARNARLQRRIDKALRKSRRRSAANGQASRRFREFRYRTRDSWSRSRRVVAKAEWLPGAGGGNPRFVVTSLDRQTIAKQVLYEELYCARGDMENRIKEQQLWLFADRTSAATMRANQLRLYFAAFAGILLTILRRAGLQGTELANARFDTIRARLIKLAGRIKVSVRRVRISLSSVYPLQELFAQALTALRAAPVYVTPVRVAPG